jgi:hypothetical protein
MKLGQYPSFTQEHVAMRIKLQPSPAGTPNESMPNAQNLQDDAGMELAAEAGQHMKLVVDTQPSTRSRDDGQGSDRREHRRHDMEHRGIPVERWDGRRRHGEAFGQIVDLSAGGVRIRTEAKNLKPDQQIRLRLELPEYAGISPFIQSTPGAVQPKREWVGWMAVCCVKNSDGSQAEIAGRLMDMDEMDRGMLGLYLSTQPLAA